MQIADFSLDFSIRSNLFLLWEEMSPSFEYFLMKFRKTTIVNNFRFLRFLTKNVRSYLPIISTGLN